jgi:hypothetical protein
MSNLPPLQGGRLGVMRNPGLKPWAESSCRFAAATAPPNGLILVLRSCYRSPQVDSLPVHHIDLSHRIARANAPPGELPPLYQIGISCRFAASTARTRDSPTAPRQEEHILRTCHGLRHRDQAHHIARRSRPLLDWPRERSRPFARHFRMRLPK